MNTSPNAKDREQHSILDSAVRWSVVASIGLLTYGYIAIAIVWFYAAQTGRVPNDVEMSRYARTGSGPWDHVGHLNVIVEHGMIAPFLAAIPAVVSLVIRPKTATAVLLGICVISGLLFVYTHFWLID